MAIAVETFLNQISQKSVRATNMFEMFITTGYPEIDTIFQTITMYGEGFEIPSRTINYGAVAFKGYSVANAVPLAMEMGNSHQMTVRADTDGELRRAFLAWQGKVMDPAISQGSVFSGDRRVNCSSIVRINLLGDDFKTVVETYRLINAKVAEVGALTVSNTDASVSTFQVTLNSTYWEIEDSKNGALKEQK